VALSLLKEAPSPFWLINLIHFLGISSGSAQVSVIRIQLVKYVSESQTFFHTVGYLNFLVTWCIVLWTPCRRVVDTAGVVVVGRLLFVVLLLYFCSMASHRSVGLLLLLFISE
jgi:hypothetical protein